MYSVKPTVKFQKDLKRIEKRGYQIERLTNVIKKLAAGALVYEIADDELILFLTRTGTHSDLF